MSSQSSRNLELVERYIAAVGRHLPPKQTQDILEELRGAVMERVEDRERGLARPLDRKEVGEILKSFGSPLLAASRYAGTQHLIGPAVYPYFWPAQRLVVGIVVAIAIVGSVVRGLLNDRPYSIVASALSNAWDGALLAFAIVTLIFIALDQSRAGARMEASWRPESLPPDRGSKPKTFFESVFSLAFDAVFIAWWVGWLPMIGDAWSRRDDPDLSVVMNPLAWDVVFYPVLALALVSAAIHAADIVHPSWTRIRSVVMMGIDLLGVGIFWVLANGAPLFTVTGPADAADRIAKMDSVFTSSSHVAVYGVVAAFAIALCVEGWRLLRSFRLAAYAQRPALDRDGHS